MAANVKGSLFCSAFDCTNNKKQNSQLSFFRFPKEEERSKKWVINCRRKDLDNKKTAYLYQNCRLCSVHFEDTQFMNSASKDKLVWTAVPTIFPAVPNPPKSIQMKRPCPRERLPLACSKKAEVELDTKHGEGESCLRIDRENTDWRPSYKSAIRKMTRPKKYDDDQERLAAKAKQKREKRIAESDKERSNRLKRMSLSAQVRRSTESNDHRAARLQRMAHNAQERRNGESDAERKCRISTIAQRQRYQRASRAVAVKHGEQPKQCKKLEHETGCNDYLCKSSSEEVVEPRGNHFSDKKAKNQPVYSEREIQVEHSYCRESTCFTEPFTEIYVQDKAVKTNKRMKPEFTEEFSEDPLCVENPETDTLFKSNNVFECAECNRIYMWNSNFKGLLYNKQVISFNCVECGSELRKEICRPWEDKSINEEKDNSDDHVGKWVDLSDKIKKEKDDYWTEEENMIKGKDWTADCIIKEEEIKQEFVNEEEIF